MGGSTQTNQVARCERLINFIKYINQMESNDTQNKGLWITDLITVTLLNAILMVYAALLIYWIKKKQLKLDIIYCLSILQILAHFLFVFAAWDMWFIHKQ